MSAAGGSVRTAVVTGAASGIGWATAELLLQRGWSVVGADLRAPDRLDPPARWVGLAVDVTDEGANESLVATAVERFGRLDAVILNAGIAASGAVDELTMDAFDRVLDVDLRAVVLGVRASLPALRRSTGDRSVVVTASTSGLGGDPRMWAYNAAKAGAVNLVRSLAMDLGPEGIRINAVCPGPTRTSLTDALASSDAGHELVGAIPLQRWGEAREVAEAIAFLASPAASFVTGAVLAVDGGVTATTGQFRPLVRR